MYSLHGKLTNVAGIGPSVAEKLALKNIHTIQDFLLWVPLRYEDRSAQKLIMDLVKDELVTIQAEVTAVSNQYKGRRSMQRATVRDSSGPLKLIWFNAPFIKDALAKGQSYFFSGKLNDRGMMTQPKVEKISDDTTHTNRLVPIYSSVPEIKAGNLRRYLKEVTKHLDPIPDLLSTKFELLPLNETFKHLHFPDDQELTIKARERLAIEELLGLMQHSAKIKQQWKDNASAHLIEVDPEEPIPTLPFTLTLAQQRSTKECLTDLQSTTPMNRLLLGDVGSGKTVVAGIAALHTLRNDHHVAFIAPTQILAEQHLETLNELFPGINIQLLTAKTKFSLNNKPTLYLGTHAVINKLKEIKPALVIYDEQHRFGVEQRSEINKLTFRPHVLTMSATPIPRSLMLTIFSHLELSVIDEMPAGRKPIKTWLVSEKKRTDSYGWIEQRLQDDGGQVLVVCPFIDPSDHEAFAKVKSATETFSDIKLQFPNQRVELLHGRLPSDKKDKITKNLFDQKIDILVTTPIVEVGIDLPAASIIIIESAERFGLASLHQLRGRVGRAGQQAYCMLFPSSKSSTISQRLDIFTKTNDGMKLAEFDLQNRGAGDLFGTDQHGFDQLRFTNWTNIELITQAKQIFDELKNSQTTWKSIISLLSANPTAN
jgi:ATP-dependent DNA helicase RecG